LLHVDEFARIQTHGQSASLGEITQASKRARQVEVFQTRGHALKSVL